MASDRSRPTPTPSPMTVMLVLCLSGTMASLQQTIMVPLLPELPRLLHTDAANASWVLTATLLSGAVATPVITRLADTYGKRRMMLVCLALMVIGGVVGGIFTSLIPVVIARVLQGSGLALIPIAIAVMHAELPPDKLSLGVSLMSTTLAVGAGIGLPLAGIVLASLPWQAVFWIPGAGALVMLIVVARVVSEAPIGGSRGFDWWGALLLGGALTSGMLALTKFSSWPTSRLLMLTALCVVLLAVFVPVQLRSRRPLVNLRVAVRPAVLLVNICSVLVGFSMFANMLLTALFLQSPPESGFGLGLSSLQAGIWQAPGAVAFALAAPVATWTMNHLGARSTLLIGCLTIGLSYLGRWAVHDSIAAIVAGSILVAGGSSLAYAAMPTLVMRAVPPDETASANGLNTLLRSVGTTSFSAFLATLTAATAVRLSSGVTAPSMTGVTIALLAVAASSLLAAAVVVPLPSDRR